MVPLKYANTVVAGDAVLLAIGNHLHPALFLGWSGGGNFKYLLFNQKNREWMGNCLKMNKKIRYAPYMMGMEDRVVNLSITQLDTDQKSMYDLLNQNKHILL